MNYSSLSLLSFLTELTTPILIGRPAGPSSRFVISPIRAKDSPRASRWREWTPLPVSFAFAPAVRGALLSPFFDGFGVHVLWVVPAIPIRVFDRQRSVAVSASILASSFCFACASAFPFALRFAFACPFALPFGEKIQVHWHRASC